ncbi:MAG: hypothetical protein JXA54_06845 [Candidatus Heimdallarchaeota archaeon]|nr:hypothetical protein [Candidatus Heimdallarchaeota archaeon]
MDTNSSSINRELYKKYEDIYENFMSNIMKNNLLTNITDTLFTNFPENLPDIVKENLAQYFDDLPNQNKLLKKYSDKISKLKAHIEEKKELMVPDELDFSEMKTWEIILFSALVIIFALATPSLINNDNFVDYLSKDFEDTIYSRQLVMIIAQLEAFIVDSMKIICYVCPDKMRRTNKVIELEKILNAKKEWKFILDVIVEHYIQKLDCKISIKKSIEILQNEFDIKIGDTNQVKIIDQSEQIRHIYIHNSGKIDLKFIENTGFKNIKIGERYHITRIDIMNCYEKSILLATELYEKITEKFFKNIKK